MTCATFSRFSKARTASSTHCARSTAASRAGSRTVEDAAILDEAKRLNGTLGEARSLLDAQGRKLDALQHIDSRLTRWEQDRKDAAILDEAKRLNGRLGEARILLDAQGRKLAALDDFERWLRDLDVKQVPAIAGRIGAMNGVVTEVHRLARAQGDALGRIEHLLDQRPSEPNQPNPSQPADETSCLERSGAVARVVSAATAPRRYGRTLLVFFDKSGTRLTPRAVKSLRELADELRRVDQPSVSIFGSADAQGDPGVSAQYAEQRAQVVKQFLEANVPQLGVRLTSARSADEPRSEALQSCRARGGAGDMPLTADTRKAAPDRPADDRVRGGAR